jgi:hypothetical protein
MRTYFRRVGRITTISAGELLLFVVPRPFRFRVDLIGNGHVILGDCLFWGALCVWAARIPAWAAL